MAEYQIAGLAELPGQDRGIAPDVAIASAQSEFGGDIEHHVKLVLVVVHDLGIRQGVEGLGSGSGSRQEKLLGEQGGRRVVGMVQHPGVHEAQAPAEPPLPAEAGTSVRLVGSPGAEILLAAIEKQRTELREIAHRQVRVVHGCLRLAEQELSVEVQVVVQIGSGENFAIYAGPTDAVGLRQAVQDLRLAVEHRSGTVAIIHAVVVALVVILEGGAALFQGDVEAVVLKPDAPAEVVGAVAQQGGNGELVIGILHPGIDPVAVPRIPFERQVGDDVFPGTQIEDKAEVPPAGVERLLVETGRRQGIRKRWHGVEVGDVPVVETEVIHPPLEGVEVSRGVGVAAKAVGAQIEPVEETLLGVLDCEIQAEEFGALAQVYDAAVFGEIAANIGEPAIAEIDVSGEPLLGGRRGGFGLGLGLRFGLRGRLGGLGIRLRGLIGRLRWGLGGLIGRLRWWLGGRIGRFRRGLGGLIGGFRGRLPCLTGQVGDPGRGPFRLPHGLRRGRNEQYQSQ